VALEGGGSPAAVEADGSVFYLSTQSDECMNDNGLQAMNPGLSSIVSSSLFDGAPVSSNCPRVDLVPPTPLSPSPPRHLGSLTAAILRSFNLIILAPLAEVNL